ncbi:MAG TPA: permease prefix domain 1-containing protein [Egicoccus sp.]|nr:permease prefix domain 1-containing protein [Egicoccus sp.]HSK23816.1 permease prefix domain 1-containing protein [Egicoccus sp.]
METQIAEWRSYVSRSPAVDGADIDELEAHLRDQIAELRTAGLTDDEAVLVAVKRMGDVDSLSREFAREHRGRLWKQLVLRGEDEPARDAGDWRTMLAVAVAAAVTIHLVRLAAGFPEEVATWLPRNAGLFVLPFLAGYFALRRGLGVRQWLIAAAPFVVSALLVNLYPWRAGSNTELLVAAHLPVALWFAVAYPYMGGSIRSREARMDFVRFTGEWVIYYVLIALGGGVLMGLTMAILEPIGPDLAEQVIVWVLPSGVVGAVIVAAWLVESKQQVVENMAPVLTMIFTPLFALMLTVAALTYAINGTGGAFDRELLGIFDALLVVVLGLVLYALSARDPMRPPGLMDRVQLVAIAAALLLDLMVLGAMVARIGELGFTPNRTAALGLNLVLLVNLAATAWLSLRFLRGQVTFLRLERWQTGYLPVFAGWAAAVVALLPLAFAFA